jgi:hypothetical protein
MLSVFPGSVWPGCRFPGLTPVGPALSRRCSPHGIRRGNARPGPAVTAPAGDPGAAQDGQLPVQVHVHHPGDVPMISFLFRHPMRVTCPPRHPTFRGLRVEVAGRLDAHRGSGGEAAKGRRSEAMRKELGRTVLSLSRCVPLPMWCERSRCCRHGGDVRTWGCWRVFLRHPQAGPCGPGAFRGQLHMEGHVQSVRRGRNSVPTLGRPGRCTPVRAGVAHRLPGCRRPG